MNKRLVLKIYGQVQGVNFRWQIRLEAEKLGLAGWVRNEDDGTVAVVAEGQKPALQNLINFCYNGVKYARVEKIESSWREATGNFSDFSIEY